MHLNAAGIDVGATEHWVAVPEDRDEEPVRRFGAFTAALIGSRALAAYDDVDESSAANNRLWSRKCTARLLRRPDASASAHGYVGTRSVRLEGAGSVG